MNRGMFIIPDDYDYEKKLGINEKQLDQYIEEIEKEIKL